MKQLVVLSGKGGTGKTSVAAAFVHLSSLNNPPLQVVLVDADVDASNLEFVLAPKILETHKFTGGNIAVIDAETCTGCGTCQEVCRFDAVYQANQVFQIDPIACEGCASCLYQCPSEAIQMQSQMAGNWFRSDTLYGKLFHAALLPAQENSGKLIAKVKQQAKLSANDETIDLMLVDGPPGIGCPVISAVSGADLALIVTEPTAAGVHDMRRVLETTDHFDVPALVCINKSDICPQGAAEIENFCREQGIQVIGKIPFDSTVIDAMVQGLPVTLYRPDSPASVALGSAWNGVFSAINNSKRIFNPN
jgi:MinD superfamily P-loop ATPase